MRSALKELETHKYLIRKRQKNSLGHFEYEYIVYELPHTENVHTEKQHTQKVHAENRRQINKEELSINKLNIDVLNKEKEKEKIDSLLQELGNADLIELYWNYIDLRKGMDAPLTAKSLEMLIARAKKLSKNNIEVEKILLETAIINSWKNVYPPKESELEHVSKDLRSELGAYFGLEEQ